MKYYLILLCTIFGLSSCGSNESANETTATAATEAVQPAGNTTIEWVDSSYQDLGKVKEGQTVEVTYRFKNSGNEPLVVSNVSAGCGCTVAEKPQEPIAPGKESIIKAQFNSAGQSVGEHRKEVYVVANTAPNDRQTLSFRVEVIK
ncbi:MAG: DUF1573 domain-containing protein [Chitinophagaceae bacterium]|nr:DUF1573 domain-containing protein [Chitinophagaceae bacterium]